MRKNLYILFATFVLASMVLASCLSPSGDGGAATPTQVPATLASTKPAAEADPMTRYAPDAVSGDIISAGSSTVFPLSERMAERFKEEGYSGNITIDSIGSGAGLERFCKTGETDIANSSRAIKDSEVESCKSIGREPLEFRVGTDALSVVVSKDNTFLTDVTKEELALIFSDKVTKWNEIRPEWPTEDILRFSPGTDSGTFDYFIEAIMGPAYPNAEGKADVDAGEKAFLDAQNLQLSEDDNVLVQGVEGSPYAIGFFGFAYYQENSDKLNAISIGGVTPTEETAENNEYPISRPLFLYSDANILQEKPQVASFIYFYLTNVNDEISDVGYFPASQASLDEGLATLAQAVE